MPDPSLTEPAAPLRCPNCFVVLPAPAPKFCAECGQETRVRAPKVGEFVQQFGGAYLATEGALWRTLKLLLFKPGELTQQYLAGRRKHYVLPLRLYLTVSVLVLLALRVSTHINIEASLSAPAPTSAPAAVSAAASSASTDAKDEEPPDASEAQQTDKAVSNVNIALGPGRAGMKDGVFYCENLPGWVCEKLNRRLQINKSEIAREMAQVGERVLGNLGAAMFLLLPMFALWLKLLHLGGGLRYTEHLVFALHVHTFWFLMLALGLTGEPWVGVPAAVATPVYTLLAMRKVYGGRWLQRIVRALMLVVLYGATMLATLTVLGLAMLLT
jgi:hypothetical protein